MRPGRVVRHSTDTRRPRYKANAAGLVSSMVILTAEKESDDNEVY